ncbi:MAG TPA: hypothetical protein VE978_15295 [Chitinophagales bacterium]|nr:hypothetical protein [Chitinophagales bacterium]
MKKFLTITFLLIGFFPINDFAQRQIHEYADDKIKCSYETSQGRIDGAYVSFYLSGQKKAEGTFENNCRISKWTVWDSTGRIRMQREYENPFVFKRIIPAAPNEKPIALLNVPRYTLEYNSDGYINDFNVTEGMIWWHKRIWRFLPITNNELLFRNNLLFQILQKNILNGNVTAYGTEMFKKEFTPLIDTSDIQMIGYKIKEDRFFDTERFLDETRILGICPVAFNKLSKDTIDLYWVYFPQIRKYLAQEKIENTGRASKIKTLDDIFFFRDFSGQIYKESNVFDRKISDYKTGNDVEKEVESIEINIIETEHDNWIYFTK